MKSAAAVQGVSRRSFLSGAFASLGAGAFGGRIFAAPTGWKPKKKPNLVFGVVSDTHMRCHYDGKSFYSHYAAYYDDQALVEVMKVFKRAGVDAILHCGDITDGGKACGPYNHSSLHLAELVRREFEAQRLDPQKPFFVATHAFYDRRFWFAHRALRRALGLNPGQFCNGLGFHGHGHGSDAHWRFNWGGDAPFPHVMCSTIAYWKAHGTEGDKPRFARGFGDEPDGGVTTLEIPAAEIPAGKKLTIAVRPCSSLGTKGKAIGTTLRV